MLKKTTLAVLGLVAGSFAFAGAMGPICTPGNVTTPCDPNRWDLGIQALYLQSIYGSNRDGAIASPGFATRVNNKWNFGFRAEGSYHYTYGNDATVVWTHYSSDTNQTGLIGIVPVFPFAAPSLLINKNRLDQIDAVLGGHIDVGLVKKMRFYGGMRYAHVQINETNYFGTTFIPFIPAVSPLEYFDNPDFKGFGPVIGLDYSYHVTPAFSVTANAAGSILFGTSRYDTGFVIATSGLVVAPVYNALQNIVPTLEAKLGLNYEYNMPQGVLHVQGGYQVENLFNVFQSRTLPLAAIPLVMTDYGLYGPYLGIKYLGNA